MQKTCEICGGKAIYTLSPDIDIYGLGACEEHLTILKQAYFLLIYLGEDGYQDYLRQFKPPNKNK
jgi:hypothetical protein